MKSLFNCLILCCLVILVGCSGGSPKPPTVTPPPGGDVWLITSLQASDSNPIVNVPVSVTAVVTLNGEPAPDGSQVEFTTNGGVLANGSTLATKLTTSGQATVGFVAGDPGPYAIQARVKTIKSTISVAYRNPDNSGSLQIWNINPAAGSYAGNESGILTGKGIRNPVEVYFTVQGVQYQAVVESVVQSVPLDASGTITIRTPEATAADKTITSQADVKVVAGVGTTDEQTQSYPSAFTYISDSVIVGDPVIFGVEPLYGRSQGGENVTILGLNFATDVTKELAKTFDKVYFLFDGQQLLAEVEQWSETQISVITPRFSLTPLTENRNAGVLLTRLDGGASVQKNDVFIVKSDIAQPDITGISPTSGPLDGGTNVTITGHGFELPVQVHFGVLEATGVQVFDDPSLADNDVITCLTPDYSQQGELPPIFVPVRVTNLQTGNTDTADQNFRYGDILYVSQANPTEGQIGDLLTLYGAGFEDPLTVWFGDIEFDVISVTGTEITLRSPPDLPPTCNDRSGNFRVVLVESNREATGGNYTLLGSEPTITAVEPIIVEETDFGNGVSPSEIDIFGVRFADDLLVRINNFTIAPNEVDVVTAEQIHVNQIPAPNDFGLVFNTGSCTTDTGLQGIRNEPTPVNVTVRNLPLACEDTLIAGLVYVPEDQECVAAPNLFAELVPSSTFPSTTAGMCSAPANLVLANNGAGDLQVTTAILVGRFFFDAGASSQNAGPITVPAFTSDTSLDVYFCPDVANGLLYQGQLVISSNDAGSPTQLNLSGTESTPPEITTNPYGDGDTWTFPATTAGTCSATETLVITSSGISDLTLSSVTSSDNVQFHIVTPPATPLTLLPSQTFNLEVEFCPTAAGAVTGTLTIDHNATNTADPIVIDFGGTGL